jgi:hypothetical protein
VDAIPLSLFYLNHPPTAIGRFLAYPSDENFPEKFSGKFSATHHLEVSSNAYTDTEILNKETGQLLVTNFQDIDTV